MKILVIGGVAAGTKTAAKLKRENRDFAVMLITKDPDISYAGRRARIFPTLDAVCRIMSEG